MEQPKQDPNKSSSVEASGKRRFSARILGRSGIGRCVESRGKGDDPEDPTVEIPPYVGYYVRAHTWQPTPGEPNELTWAEVDEAMALMPDHSNR